MLTLESGNLVASNEVLEISGSAVNAVVNIKGGKMEATSGNKTLGVYGNGSVVNMSDGELKMTSGTNQCVYLNGTFNMSGGKIVSSGAGVYIRQDSELNVSGDAVIQSSYSQYGAIYVDGDEDAPAIVNITGGTVESTNNYCSAITSTSSSYGEISISGGSIKTANNRAVFNFESSTNEVAISGGTFSSSVEQYLPEGLTQDEEGNVVIDTEVAVAIIGETVYFDFHDAVADAMSGDTVTLLKDTTVDSWEQIWNLSVVTIDGQGNELTVNAVTSNGNGDYLVYGAEDLNVKDLTIKFTTNGNGFTLDSGKFESVNMYAGESSSYAIFVGTSNKEDAKVEINACYFEGFDAAVYSQPGNGTVVTSDISITESNFDGCGMSVCSYASDTVFNGNIVTNCGSNSFAGCVDTGNTDVTYEIKNNTFNNGGKIWFYGGNLGNVVFEKNSVQGDTYLTTESSAGGTLNVSNNYWGGEAPSEEQIQGEGNVTGKDKYYLKPTMDDDDISVFYDVYYVYNNGAGMGYERVLKGESVTLTTPSKSGYAFLGWACSDGKNP
ncbi:MAG: hypothetical protein ACLTSG_07120 [Lachnospiraceae bacterium]